MMIKENGDIVMNLFKCVKNYGGVVEELRKGCGHFSGYSSRLGVTLSHVQVPVVYTYNESKPRL